MPVVLGGSTSRRIRTREQTGPRAGTLRTGGHVRFNDHTHLDPHLIEGPEDSALVLRGNRPSVRPPAVAGKKR
jgi:hypothetical protein